MKATKIPSTIGNYPLLIEDQRDGEIRLYFEREDFVTIYASERDHPDIHVRAKVGDKGKFDWTMQTDMRPYQGTVTLSN